MGGLGCSKGREGSTHTGIVRRILSQNDIFLHMSKCGVGCSKPLPTENIQFIPEKDFFPPAHLLDKAVAKIELLPFSWTERAGAEGREIVEVGGQVLDVGGQGLGRPHHTHCLRSPLSRTPPRGLKSPYSQRVSQSCHDLDVCRSQGMH